MILHMLKATAEHRCTPIPIRCTSSRTIRMYKKVDSLWSDLRPGGARPVDEGNAADQSGLSANAVLICSIPLIHRGVPRQVARGALSVSFRLCPCLRASVLMLSRALRPSGSEPSNKDPAT